MSRLTLARPVAAILAGLVLAAALVPLTARPVAAAYGADLVNVANDIRAANGRGPVTAHAVVNQIAAERGREVARIDELVHDFDYVDRFAQEGICWESFGEILAWNSTGSFEGYGEQWFNSTPHRSIMLGSYTHAGGSREPSTDASRYYGVMIFVKLCGASAPSRSIGGFTDIGSSSFQADILWLVSEGITAGCGPDRFCPTDPVTRGEMATFVKRVLGLPGASRDYFRDDATSTHQDSINRMAAASLTAGCGGDRYCPTGSVTRAQMASFLDRSLALPATSRDFFTDDNGTTYEAAVNRLAAAGLVSGCTASRFCGERAVSREQMAAFLHRAYGG